MLLLSRFSRVREGNPPGSPVPWILQARTLEWVAIYITLNLKDILNYKFLIICFSFGYTGSSLLYGGYSLVAVHRLLTVGLLVQRRALGTRASVVVVHAVSCSGIFSDQGPDLHWQVDSPPLNHQASP